MKKIIVILWASLIALPCFSQYMDPALAMLGRTYEKGMLTRTAALPGDVIVGKKLMAEFMDFRTLPMKEFVAKYIVVSPVLSAEITKGLTNSVVGSYNYRHALDVKTKTQFLGDNLSSRIARYAVPQIDLVKMDGYILSFPKAEKQMDLDADNYTRLTRMEWLLEKLLKQPSKDQVEKRFFGAFLPNVGTLEYASQFASHPTTLAAAFEKAMADGRAAKSGFFVIGEHPAKPETEMTQIHRLKDLYILDLEHDTWISYNHSKAAAWKQILAANPGQYGAKVMPVNTLRQRYIDTPIRDHMDGEKIKVLSNDGVTGIISTDALEQFQILGATHTVYDHNLVPREKPYYIYLQTFGDPIPLSQEASEILGIKAIYLDYKILFAAEKGSQFFNSIREVEHYLKWRNELKEPPAPSWK